LRPLGLLDAPQAATRAYAAPSAGGAGSLVLVLGSQTEAKEAFGAALAAKLGGSVLDLQKLMEAESAAGSEAGETILSYITEGKIVPAPLCLQLLQSAKVNAPAPHVLVDFPRVATQLEALEASLGGVQLGLALASDEVCAGIWVKALGAKLTQLEGFEGEAAVAAAEAALSRM